MLRITECTQSGRAKSYYTARSNADYYMEGQEIAGTWNGKGAERLGLGGAIDKADWELLCDNQIPGSGEKLTVRTKATRRVGWDFNWHVPKSVSVLQGLTGDPKILSAFEASVNETMQDIEADAKTRLRRNGRNEDQQSGNLLWGTFIHQTARPVEGIPDPHLHAHCFVMNATFDETEHRWKAAQIGDIKRDGQYYETLFHARMARRLTEMGIPVVRTKRSYEIAGIDKPLRDKFSRRTEQVEKHFQKLQEEMEKERMEASSRGEESNVAVLHKHDVGAMSRERKKKDLSMTELRREWVSRLTADEANAVNAATAENAAVVSDHNGERAREAASHAVEHLFERKAVVPERLVMVEAMKRSYGEVSVDEIRQAVAEQPLITGELKGRRMATTTTALAEETAMIQFAREGQGTCRPLVFGPHVFKRDWLNGEQRKAVEHILSSRDRVMLLRGQAGTGKTTLMKEAVEAIEAAGTKVYAFAPSADASRGTLRGEGFENAETVAMFLSSPKIQEAAQGQLLWFDEAGLIGTRTMAKIFAVAESMDARVVLQGDTSQHGPVERGSALRLLQDNAGIRPAELKTIQRQEGDYRDAGRMLSQGKTEAGFHMLDRLGWIREVPGEERYAMLAKDYVSSVQRNKGTLILAPAHREATHINEAVRAALRGAKMLRHDERSFDVLTSANLTVGERRDPVNLRDGDVLEYHQNAPGHVKGERLTVGQKPLPLRDAERFTAYHVRPLAISPGELLRITKNGTTIEGGRLNNGSIVQVKGFTKEGDIRLKSGGTIRQDWGHWAYGYVQTSHGSQGRTVDVALIAQSGESFPASSREQFYVSLSRARKYSTVYTVDKKSLLQAVCQSDDRLSATELVRDQEHGHRAHAVARQNAMEPSVNLRNERRERYVEQER